MLAAEIVYTILDELAKYKGLDIEQIVQDNDTYEDILDTLIETVDNKLTDRMQGFLD